MGKRPHKARSRIAVGGERAGVGGAPGESTPGGTCPGGGPGGIRPEGLPPGGQDARGAGGGPRGMTSRVGGPPGDNLPGGGPGGVGPGGKHAPADGRPGDICPGGSDPGHLPGDGIYPVVDARRGGPPGRTARAVDPRGLTYPVMARKNMARRVGRPGRWAAGEDLPGGPSAVGRERVGRNSAGVLPELHPSRINSQAHLCSLHLLFSISHPLSSILPSFPPAHVGRHPGVDLPGDHPGGVRRPWDFRPVGYPSAHTRGRAARRPLCAGKALCLHPQT